MTGSDVLMKVGLGMGRGKREELRSLGRDVVVFGRRGGVIEKNVTGLKESSRG